jgi:hypothetical protein
MQLKTAAATLAFTALLLAGTTASAQEAGGAAFDPSATIADNLKKLLAGGKPVELVLENGKSYKGKLGAIGDHMVVVTQIEGREFFDALVVIDQIAAIEVRAR